MTIYDTRILKTRNFSDVQERTIQLIRKDRKPIMKVEDVSLHFLVISFF